MSKVSREHLVKAKKVARSEGAEVLYSDAVMKIHDKKKGQKKRILIITDLFITYFKDKSKPVEDRKHYWRNVSSFNFVDNRIELYFEKSPFRFTSTEAEKIAGILMEVFLRCFSVDELAPLDLSRFAHPPISVNGLGILSRLSVLLRSASATKKNDQLLKDFKKYLKQFLQFSPKAFKIVETEKISLTKADDTSNFKTLLEAIRPVPFLNVLILPKFEETDKLFINLGEFISKNSNVRMISFENAPDDKFEYFSNNVINSSGTNITGLAFNNVELTDEDLNRVRELTTSSEVNINSLSFNNSIKEPSLSGFAANFLTPDLSTKISFLSLDNIKIDLKDVVNRLGHVSVLSLRNCDLEISYALTTIAMSKMKSLRYLNLSENRMSDQICEEFELPQYLERLDVNKVKWEKQNTLSCFITLIFNQRLKHGLKFYCNGAIVEDDDWDSVFNAFGSLGRFPLVEFSWNKNKVSKPLFEFLRKNENLKVLFLNKVFDVNKDEEIQQFSDILPSLSKCTTVVIRGATDYELQEKVTTLYESMGEMASLKYLDISGNNIHAEGINGLCDLVTKSGTLSHISFDFANIEEIECMKKLISSGEERRKPLYISWPLHDIKRLKKSSKLDENEISDLKRKLTRLSTGITNAKTIAFRKASTTNNEAASMRITSKGSRNTTKAANKSPNNKSGKQKGGSVRDIRGGSFRGQMRPNLLLAESLVEADEESPLNQPFEAYIGTVSHKFPLYFDEELTNQFNLNPIPFDDLQDSSDSSSSSPEIIGSISTPIEPNVVQRDVSVISPAKKKDIIQKETKQKNKNIEAEEEYSDSVIELGILKDPEIPLIPQLSFPKDAYKYISPKGISKLEQLNISSGCSTTLKPLDLPKLQLLGRAPPLLSVGSTKAKKLDHENGFDKENVNLSSMMKDNDTNELNIIKPTMKTEELSDFSSSSSSSSDDEFNGELNIEDENDDEIEELIVGEFPKLSKQQKKNRDILSLPKSKIISDDEDDNDYSEHRGINLLPESVPKNYTYAPPAWGFPIDRTARVSNHVILEDMSETYGLDSLVQKLEEK